MTDVQTDLPTVKTEQDAHRACPSLGACAIPLNFYPPLCQMTPCPRQMGGGEDRPVGTAKLAVWTASSSVRGAMLFQRGDDDARPGFVGTTLAWRWRDHPATFDTTPDPVHRAAGTGEGSISPGRLGRR
jgi:hypothetical protein